MSGESRSGGPLRELEEELQALHDQLAAGGKGRRRGTGIASRPAGAVPRARAALERAREQFREGDRERGQLRALADVSRAVTSSLDLGTVLDKVMDTIIELSGAERGFLMLRNDRGKLDFRVARGLDREALAGSEFALSRSVVERVARTGELVATTDAREDPRFQRQASVRALDLRSILCLPLQVRDKLVGVIYADNRAQSGRFVDRDRDVLLAFAGQAAVALENARLFEEVRGNLAEATRLKTLLDNVFESITSGVITTDGEDRVTLLNRAAAEILRLDPEAAVGRPYDRLLPSGSFLEHWTQRFDDVKRADKVLSYEIRPEVPERGAVDLSLSLAPLKDAARRTRGVAIVVDDQTERKRLRRKFELFRRMVSPAVIERLNPEELRLGGERQTVSCLFADVRGFTSFSEGMDPVELLDVLNRYLGAAADAVLAQEGTLDKFLGDAVMAIFNAPERQEDHPRRALRAAEGIRDRIRDLRARSGEAGGLSFGIGLHAGEAVVGLVGTELRVDYTAIGDTINTTKRIQENAAPDQILVSGALRDLLGPEPGLQPLEPLRVKGRRRPVEVFELRSG